MSVSEVKAVSDEVFCELEGFIREIESDISKLKHGKKWNISASRRLRLNIQGISNRRSVLKRALMKADALSRKHG